MSPFKLLGLPADADELAIKRAYAQRLRVTRPEDDPQGFQRLHAAYQSALEHSRKRSHRAPAAATDIVVAEDVPHSAAPLPDPPVAQAVLPRFDVDAFCSAAFERAAAGDAAALQAWLAGQQELWSLQLKNQTGRQLVEQLYQREPPMPADCMETLLRFFDLDHALAGHDPFALLRLERRMRLAWQLQDNDEARLASRLAIRTSVQRGRAHWILGQLQRPFRWRRVLWVGMLPAHPGFIADFVENVSDHHPEDFPATIDREQVDFWLAAARRRPITRPRLILGGVRSAAVLLLAILMAPLLSKWFIDSVALQPMLTAIAVLMIPCALWALWMAWSLIDQWHIDGGSLPGDRSARMYLVPALCATGVILDASGRGGGIGLVLLLPALWLSLRRYWHQHPSRHALFRPGNVRIMLFASIFLLRGVLGSRLGDDLLSLDAIIAAAAMLAWAVDLWKQHRQQAGAG